jgi:hypothetical protein
MPAAGSVLQLNQIISADDIGNAIAVKYQEWESFLNEQKGRWKELYAYIYATDTTKTSNAGNPWKNTTTTPKLTQIRDNLYANYMASLFPTRRWLKWEGATKDDESKDKTDAILAYMGYVIEQPQFKETVARLILDYIDTGNTFAMPAWLDERVEQESSIQVGYVGPVARRIAPADIVFNPAAEFFVKTPKIVRSLISLGELKDLLDSITVGDEDRNAADELFKYLRDVRMRVSSFQGDLSNVDTQYQIDGFTSFRNYLESGYAEVLTFYGDLYVPETGEFLKNHIIQVVDRHKVIRKGPNPSALGTSNIYHSGWRPRQDNLWAMGPLENLVGLQYRLDHTENLKSDFFDMVYAPPLKVRGYVEDFTWAPLEKIYVGDDGDVEIVAPTINPLQANFELDRLVMTMEEMAGAPKEAMGFRTPGEKTMYEVQRLENAASRIFQAKIAQFEEQILEPLLNGMLELARRHMDETTLRVIDDEYKVATFMNLTADDISGAGRIRPIGARHFVEQSQRVQNVNMFFSSAAGQDEAIRSHFSSVSTAKMFEELLDLQEYKLVEPYIRLTEQAEAQQLSMQHEEDTLMGLQTPSGMTPEDSDVPFI